MTVERHRLHSPEAAAAECARRIQKALAESLQAGRVPTLAVSGGATPALLFDALARTEFEWSRVHLFQVDERAVPPSDPQSNHRLLSERFLTPAAFPPKNVHRVRAELAPDEAAAMYEGEIREFFAIQPPELPRFDVVHLGLGADAHTASLFPGGDLLGNRDRLAAAVYVKKLHQWRITLLPGPLLAARSVVFLVAGRDKANAAFTVLYGPEDHVRFPAQAIARRGSGVAFYMDEEAGFDLEGDGAFAAP